MIDKAPPCSRKKTGKKQRSPDTASLRDFLSVLFPYKKDYFDQQSPRLSIRFTRGLPWAPPPVRTFSLINPSLEDKEGTGFAEALSPGLADASRKFGIPEIEVVLPGEETRLLDTGITLRRKSMYRLGEAIVLSPFEAALFYRAVTTGSYEKAEIVTLLERSEGTGRASLSSQTLILPEGKPLAEVLDAEDSAENGESAADNAGNDNADNDNADNEDAKKKFINPVTGEEFGLADTVSFRTRSLTPGAFRFTGGPGIFPGLPGGSTAGGGFGAGGTGGEGTGRARGYSVSVVPIDVKPCSNCLACARVCPSRLYPSLIYHHLMAEDRSEAVELNIAGCISCGLCSSVCPSSIPLAAEIIPARVELERIYADES